MGVVLITTSGVGSRLSELTQYTNKSLITIGGKAVLSHIIESYPEDTEFVLTLGHFGTHVQQYIGLAHPNLKVKFVTVDNFDGPGSSLLYSMLQARQELQGSFIYHCCDTIVPGTKPFRDTNWLAYGPKAFDPFQYRMVRVREHKIEAMLEKGTVEPYSGAYLGICGIYDWEMFWNLAEFWYDKSPGQSDCTVIMKMLDCLDFDALRFYSWFDMGNERSLKSARANFTSEHDVLDKVDESIHFVGESVIKFFANEEIVANRAQRAMVELDGLVPEVTAVRPNFYKYGKVAGDLLADAVNEPIFRNFLTWSWNNLWSKTSCPPGFSEKCRQFYYDKTLERIGKFCMKSGIKDTSCIINGIEVPGAVELMRSIPMSKLCGDLSSKFHGDFIMDNILFDGEKFTLLDWRQDFAGSTVHGDFYYDISKLRHNLTFNHALVSKGHFTVKDDGPGVKVDILRQDMFCGLEKVLDEFMWDKGLDIQKVRLLTPIIWLNMCGVGHETPLATFLYYFGRWKLFSEVKQL